MSTHHRTLQVAAFFDAHPSLLSPFAAPPAHPRSSRTSPPTPLRVAEDGWRGKSESYSPSPVERGIGGEVLEIGGVTLPSPFILAAGFVKGTGFADETSALAAVQRGDNIIPSWRSVPRIVGAVEFGSFTRWPRLGNPGTVLWRDIATKSLQNRIGLKNPGAKAAAAFLRIHKADLPLVFGLNLAPSPGVAALEDEERELLELADAFLSADLYPSWFTLNLSCPNTEDDPSGNQSADKAEQLAGALVQRIGAIPLWVKISPALSRAQYSGLLRAFAKVGVRAVIATNTLGQPAPDGTTAGISGGKLFAEAAQAVKILSAERHSATLPLDIIACGNVMDQQALAVYRASGVRAFQYWSALIYRGPFAARLLEQEWKTLDV